MKLNIIVEETARVLDVPDEVVRDGEDFFAKMDRDMDRGWQMSREFVEHPDRVQRCQIAAHRLLGALSVGKHEVALLMAGYILNRAPGVTGLDIDTTGEISSTQLLYDGAAAEKPAPASAPVAGLSKVQALEQAGKEVSKVYKVGQVYRYAVLDRASGNWTESAPMDDAREAEAARLRAVKRRFDELSE
ncbi:hypothetical protein SVA_1938 [Sulfurifustis variabilis]|uniref:Uncharacterized protein n=1 Tax=Sulfurifustis variabilis TaxID=1675686 RepID=A0A1B4VBX5_9GAMM|nr:hypothetical protein [Sulfurifustis variabilis]BAU48491.1 hypothetical protein SVA_1938 [Sulfurifustis variabilis]